MLLNNPISFIDPDGNFEIDKKTAEDNPELAKYLQNMLNEWNNKSDDFKNAFYETSGLNEKQVVEMLTYGSGPKLEVVDLDTKDRDGDGKLDNVNGVTMVGRNTKTGQLVNMNNGKGHIQLDDNVVGMFENATTMGDKQVGKIMVESTLYHEGTHYGNLKTSASRNGKFPESGKAFETKAYGQDINRGGVKKYWQSQQLKPLTPLPAVVK